MGSGNGPWTMNQSGFKGLKAANVVKRGFEGWMGVPVKEEELTGVGLVGFGGPLKSEVFISEADEAIGGCLSLGEAGGSLDQTCTGILP